MKKIFIRNWVLCSLLCIIVTIPSFPSFAETETQESANKTSIKKSSEVLHEIIQSNKENDKGAVPIRYVPANYENVMRMMWMLGAYQVSDTDAIDNYIRVSECDLYKKYYYDEFEWRKIQLATISYLQKYAYSFSNYVEIIQPVQIGRYDFDLQGFALKDSELFNMAAIQITDNKVLSQESCKLGKSYNDPRFTPTAIVKLKSPINLDFIRVPHDLAKEYIRFLEDKDGQLSEKKEVFFRYRIRIDRFMQVEQMQSIGSALIFSGQILQIDIYADREMFLPLFSQQYE
ncbi:MAG: DUF4852 domain-containing protein [Alphaproteobacteria bacterium]|nr:DUF4852 domain-containing protein [Alphaproteobacteria bacterium]